MLYLLTWDLKSGISAEGGPHDVAGKTLVNSAVHFFFAVDSAKEEETAIRKNDSVGTWVRRGCLDQNSIFVPIYDRLWLSTCLKIMQYVNP